MSGGWERIRLRVETKTDMSGAQQAEQRTISTHILDTSSGRAAAKVPVTLYRHETSNAGAWTELRRTVTDDDGRAAQLLEAADFKSAIYKLRFDVRDYYAAQGVSNFYPYVEIVVECVRGQHYHIPLLLSPYGYTTYRGT